MIKFFIFSILNIFDFFYKKKLIQSLKKLNVKKIDFFFDVGGHKGESIKFFSKYIIIKKIFSFEASPENFYLLKKKI